MSNKKRIIFLLFLAASFEAFATRPSVYIDPSAGSNGSGTYASPYNTWASVSFSANTDYRQKRGTSYTTSAQIHPTGNNVKICAYGSGTTRPLITYTGTGKAFDCGSTTNMQFDSIECIATAAYPNEAVTIVHLITGGRASITNCYFHGISTTQYPDWIIRDLASSGLLYLYNNEFSYSGNDGVFLQNLDSVIAGYNNIHHVNNLWFSDEPTSHSQTIAGGDCLQFSCVHWFDVNHNTLDHQYTGNKFCFISENSDCTNPGDTSHGTFTYNTCLRSNEGTCVYIYSDQSKLQFKYNTFKNADWGIQSEAMNIRFYFNQFYNLSGTCYDGIGTSGTTYFINNSIYNCTSVITEDYNENIVLRNNILHTITGRAFLVSHPNTDYNDYYNVSTLGITAGAHDITTNPVFINAGAANFALASNSPCINTGTNYLTGFTDFAGVSVPQNSTTDMGSLEYTGGGSSATYEGSGILYGMRLLASNFYNTSKNCIINNAVTSISVTPPNATLNVNGTQQLTATINSDATIKGASWSSSATGVATVNSSGLVTAIAGGTANITGIAIGNASKTGISAITVNIPVTGVIVAPTTVSLTVGATQQLVPTIIPSNATNKNVTYGSANAGIASVTSPGGLITGVTPGGPVNITVHTADGNFTANCATTVTGATWQHTMMLSYISINSHYTFTQAMKDTIENRLGNTYNLATFGPSGQNKAVCDFIQFFWNSNSTTALSAKTETKTGATLRWEFPTVYNQNNFPSNICNGVISVSSTDGFATWTVVDLHSNTFINCLPSFQYFTGLTSFNASSNNFTGAIASFSTCTALTSFSLSGTTNTGTLPSFAACTLLTAFDINGSTFTGTLPSFAACTLLSTFNISSCTFTGSLPTFAACTALTSFYATWVGFTGAMPSFSTCSLLSILQVNGNSFTGSTSDFTGNHITNIRMQQNGFTVNGTTSNAFNVAATNFNVSDNSLPTAQIDALLVAIDTYYSAHAPTSNCTFNMGGTNGGATGGQSNTARLHIISVYTTAGKTATVTNN